VVRLTLTNNGSQAAEVTLKLSGRERNLPGHVVNRVLENGAGEDVALVTETGGASVSSEDHGLTLALRVTLPARATRIMSVEVPYEWQAARNAELSQETSETLLDKSVKQWDGLWAGATKIDFRSAS